MAGLLENLLARLAAPYPGGAPSVDPYSEDADPYAALNQKAAVTPPPTAFDTGAQPISRGIGPVAGLLSGMTGLNPASGWAGPPKTNDPFANEPEIHKNGIIVHRPDPRASHAEPSEAWTGPPPIPGMAKDALASASTPQNAPAAGPGGIQGLLGRLLSPTNAGMFMALGSGLAGAPSFGQGMSRGFARAAPFVQQNTGINATVEALVKKGYSPNDAIAIATNKEALTRMLPQLFGGGTPTLQTVTGPDGMPQSAWVNAEQQTATPVDLSKGPPHVRNEADYKSLPVGTTYIDPKGNPRIKSAGGG